MFADLIQATGMEPVTTCIETNLTPCRCDVQYKVDRRWRELALHKERGYYWTIFRLSAKEEFARLRLLWSKLVSATYVVHPFPFVMYWNFYRLQDLGKYEFCSSFSDTHAILLFVRPLQFTPFRSWYSAGTHLGILAYQSFLAYGSSRDLLWGFPTPFINKMSTMGRPSFVHDS